MLNCVKSVWSARQCTKWLPNLAYAVIECGKRITVSYPFDQRFNTKKKKKNPKNNFKKKKKKKTKKKQKTIDKTIGIEMKWWEPGENVDDGAVADGAHEEHDDEDAGHEQMLRDGDGIEL